MKYVMNHEDDFVSPWVVYFLGLIQLIFCFTFELINMIILFSKSNVQFTVGAYLTVTILKDLCSIYYNKTVGSDSNKDILKNIYSLKECQLPITHHSAEWKEKKGTWFRAQARFTYKLFRSLYASIVFYFVPFLFIVFTQNLTVNKVLNDLGKINASKDGGN